LHLELTEDGRTTSLGTGVYTLENNLLGGRSKEEEAAIRRWLVRVATGDAEGER
jgi:hypothetical protein